MKEKIKGLLAGLIFRMIALLTLGQISPILSACVIIEQEGKILLIDRADGLGYTMYWHKPLLFQPNNFAGNPENVFDNIASYNMLCIPKANLNFKLEGFEQVVVPPAGVS